MFTFLMYIFPVIYYFSRTSTIEEFPNRPIGNNCNAKELGKSKVDLRKLSSHLPVVPEVTEIIASLDSHPPIKYFLTPAQVSVPDYMRITPTVNKNIFI